MTRQFAVVGLGALLLSACGSVRESSQGGSPVNGGGNGGSDGGSVGGAETGGTGTGGSGAGGSGTGGGGAGGILIDGGPPAACVPGKIVAHDIELGSAHPEAVAEVLGAAEIQGKLTVDGDDRDDLQVLSCLTKVSGDVQIGLPKVCSLSFGCFPSPTSHLKSLAGLERLSSIGGSINVDTNAELESLGGLSGLTGEVQDLFIGSNPLVTSLSPFRGITHVRGRLSIYDSGVTSLAGLESISTVDGWLQISATPDLVDLAGLDSVTTAGRVLINQNKRLESLKGLDRLTTIGESLELDGNPALKSFAGLGALGEIKLDLFVTKNQSIESFAGLESLRRVGGTFTVTEAPSLRTLAPLSGVTFIGKDMTLSGTHLANLDDFPAVTKLPGGLSIADAPYLTNIRALANVTETATLTLTNLPLLASLAGLEGLTKASGISLGQMPGVSSLAPLSGVRGVCDIRVLESGIVNFSGLEGITSAWLVVNNANELTSLKGLEGLTSATWIDIRWNPKLATITGLSFLTKVDGDFVIMHNDALPSLAGLEALTTVTGHLEVTRNALVTTLAPLSGLRGPVNGLWVSGTGLTNLHGLEGITSVVYDLGIGFSNWESATGSTGLTSLHGLEGITSVNNLLVSDNADLADLGGLANLQTVTENVHVHGNAKLARLGLTSLTTVSGGIGIYDNASLPTCEPVAVASRVGKTCGIEVLCQNVCDCPGNNGTGTCP